MRRKEFLDAQQAVLARYGVQAEQRFVDVPVVKGQAQVLVSGEGPPVIFLDGIGTPSAMWAPLMARLNGFRLHAVDLPGFGLTDTMNGFADDLRTSAITFVEQVLDGLDLDRPVIIGNSLGSLWSSWFAITRPSRVDALVHVGCPAVVLDTSAPLPMRLLSVPLVGRAMMKLQPPSARQVRELAMMVREHPLPSEIADLLLATERLPGFEEIFLTILHALVTLRGSRPDMALTADQLGRIEAPSLLIFARDDPMGSAQVGQRVAEALRSAKLHVVDGGHAPWIHHADRIGPLITAFLDNAAASKRFSATA
jgi:pimeloyl-ACP methyl ester carboxylesterase